MAVTRRPRVRGPRPQRARAALGSRTLLSLRLRKRPRGDLVEGLELGELLLDEFLAVALALHPGRLLDPLEVLVVAVGRLLRILPPLEAHNLRHQLDGEP